MLFKFKRIVGCIEPWVKNRDTNRIVSLCIVTALISNGMFYISRSTYPMVCTVYHIVHVPWWKKFPKNMIVQKVVWKEIQLTEGNGSILYKGSDPSRYVFSEERSEDYCGLSSTDLKHL